MFDFTDPLTWGVGLAGAALVAIIWRVDTRLEGIKDHALELKEHADRLGLSFLSGFLKKFAIGDKSGMTTSVVQAVQTMRDPAQRLEVIRRVAQAATTLLMENSGERAALLEHIEKLKRTYEEAAA